ncbi:MAG: Cu(I)-responsive transcriptional regulator [Alphaproteobacteria bacterium]|nr:Cu(I)-responsive transcriptional regulator [Rhodospirillales bacterium]MCW9045656.1 Cu(I)-responsive transcriptional regulator [Alphaproteobacteria bacterium]
MNIGTVSKLSGVPAKTIRYYESVGLLPDPVRSENGYRTYGDQEVETLKFVQRSRKLGFKVKDVAALLTLWQDKNRASGDVKALAVSHIQEVEERIKELEAIRSTLLHLVNRCHGDDRPDCPILEGISEK